MDAREAKLWRAIEAALEGSRQLKLTFPELKQFLGECLMCHSDPDVRSAASKWYMQVREEEGAPPEPRRG